MFSIGGLLLCFTIVALSTETIPTLIEKGFTESMAAMAGSLFGISSLIGNVIGGKVLDKLGSFIPMLSAGVLITIALLIMEFIPDNISIGLLVPICSGLMIYAVTTGPSFMSIDVFGFKDGMKKVAKVGMFYAAGSALGAVGFAILSSNFGVKTICLILLVIALIGFILNGIAIVKSRKMFIKR
ncbi:Major Facilitator Superfamily [uncultured Clostridium sp.]|uniref:MFS transporter n=1 Tax=uncultured Clostridium sp. TaxID=59620 RepID=UPI000821B73C|nr:MFS transporter [uncultured Clostridium sp.]SCJ00947.1 Major Facilitator Superfamily [uncultured Clostridium sp.]